ncbi:hypothetical protein NKH18_01185 [Streptomyces sp. M10(2022)]
MTRRLNQGWDPQDPLLLVSLQHLVRPSGHWDLTADMLRRSRPKLESVLDEVGHEYVWARGGTEVPARTPAS